MVRIRLTGPTRLEPAPRGTGPAATRRALEQLDGVLALEVDGVDLTGGRAEGPLLPALEAILEALARLQAGAPSATATLHPGGLLLLLRHQAGQVLLTLVDLGPPARLPVHDTEVELAALTSAALEAAADLCRSLAAAPSLGALAARRLGLASRGPTPASASASTPASASASTPASASASTPASTSTPTSTPTPTAPVRCEVELDEDLPAAGPSLGPPGLAELLLPGRVRFLVGGRTLDLRGLPFLSLRDLVAGLGEIARAEQRGDASCTIRLGRPGRAGDALLRFDLADGTLSLDGAPAAPARPLQLGAAARAAVGQLEHGLARVHPPALDHPLLRELLAASESAAAHLAEVALGDLHLSLAPAPAAGTAPAASQQPLAPGVLRRVALRIAWRDHVGEPVGPGLLRAGAAVLATGRGALIGRAGPRSWRAPGADWAALAAGVVLARRGERLHALDPASGRERWSRPLLEAFPTGAAGRRGGLLLLGEAGALSALDPRTGELRWRLELPGGHGLALAAFGPLVVAGSASGLLHAVDLEGRVAWRVRAPGPALAPPLLVGPALASLHAAGLVATLLLVDPATGRRLGEVALDVVPAGAPLAWAGGVALAGRSGGAAVVTLVRPASGRAWTVEAPLAGSPRLSAAGRALLAGDAEGALACLEPSGRLSWSLPAAGGAGGAAPVAVRGVVLAARDGLALLDLASGRALGAVEGLQPARLLAGGALSVTALEADGAVTGLLPAGHLSLV